MAKPVGVLLAAGLGRRFDASGARSKLMARLPDGTPVVLRSLDTMLQMLPRVIAVVRETDAEVLSLLGKGAAQIVTVPAANAGMGESIAAAVEASAEQDGWLIALGDMPYLRAETIARLTECISGEDQGQIVVPTYRGRRGHPVFFGAKYREALRSLRGDTGARAITQDNPVRLVEVDDPGILLDVDTPEDLD